MKLADLKAKCEQLGLHPIPTKKRCNPDRFELSIADCTKAIKRYYVDKLQAEGKCDYGLNMMLMLNGFMLANLITQQTCNMRDEVWSDYNDKWQFQRKYDGIRLMLIYDGLSRKLSVFSRNISEETLLPLEYSMNFDFNNSGLMLDNFVIDVELVYRNSEDYNFRSIKDDFADIIENKGIFKPEEFKFVILDTLVANSIWLVENTLLERYKYTSALLLCLKSAKNGYVFESVDIKPDNMTKEEYYYYIVDNGGEGIIAKNINSPYEFKRSNNWLKIKPKLKEAVNPFMRDTLDAFVSGYNVNGNTNLIDMLNFSIYVDDIAIPVAKVYLGSDLQSKVTREDAFGNIILNGGFHKAVAEFSFDVLDQNYLMQHPKLLYWRIDKDFTSCSYTAEYLSEFIKR